MITTYKSKAYDAVADINGLKDQLGSVLKEISAFGSRLEETKALQLHADEFGFARSFSYEDRLRDLKQKLQPGKEPAKPVIFLTRMVVESLSRGPMSEKDIKTIVLDRCKELGIKSSNRGLIAGTGMDVATVCSVLAALGAIEATAPPDPKADNSVTNATTSASGGSGVVGGVSGSGGSGGSGGSVDYTSSGYTSASSATDVIAGPGAGVYAVLTDRWQSRLSEYIEDALKGKAAALLEAAESGAVGGSGGGGGGVSGGMNSASSNASGGGVVKNVFSNNTSANTSAGVTPSASSNNIVSMASPITAINTTNTTNTIANTNTASTINTIANNTSSNNAQTVNSSSTNNTTNHTNTTNTTATTTNNTINTNTTTTTMSNTARLIAEYHSRNGTDPNTINNTNTNTNTAGSVKGVQKPIQNYFVPLNGSVGSVPNANVNNNINSNMQNSNSIQGSGVLNVLNTSTTLPNTQPTTQSNTLPYTSASVPTIGHRAPLSTDLPMGDTTNTSNATINNTMNSNINGGISGTNTTALKQTPYTLPAYQTNVPYTTQPQLHPNAYTLPLHPYSSNPATTPATVGFLSVTHPTNRLVIPNLNNNNHSDGTLSHSGSLNNVANGSSVGVSGMNSINSSVVGGINNSMQYGAAPTVHNTMPIVPINSIPPNTTNNTSNATNTTTTTTTTTKTKTPKAPKPPTEKKLSKKAAAAAAKLLESANASSTSGSVGVNGTIVGSGVVGSAVQGSSASSSVAGTITTNNTTNSNKARRGPSALRVWKLREEYVLMDISGGSSGGGSNNNSSSAGGDVKPILHNTNTTNPIANTTNNNSTTNTSTTNNTTPSTNPTNAALALLLDPTSLHTTATTHHTLSSTLELEERILRRIAGLCNIPLQPQRYRVGTSVISTSDTSSTENKTRVYSSFKYNTTPVVEEVVEEPSYAVYDDTTTITATYLLDKIRRTKRQRGECLYGNIHLPYTSTSSSVNSARSAAAASVGVYSAPHVHALSAVCSKTNEFYWNTKTAKNKKAAPVKSNEPITMAQYARNVHTGAGGNSIVLSSCSNGSSITNHTLKRYAQPLELTNAFLPLCDMTNRNVFAAATGGAHNTPYNTTNSTNTTSNNGSVVLSIPDLTLNTREIAWTEIAAEFTVLQAPTEEGSIGFGYSSSTAALDSVVSSSAAPKSEKKRKYLGNDKGKSGASGKGKGSASTSASSASASLAMEVLAPQFTEIVPVTVLVEQIKASSPQAAAAYPSSDSEDTSDEACLSRHEATLQSMRDKWTRLQQLKNDALYGVGNGPEVKTYRGGGYGGYFNRNTPASANNSAGGVELSPLGSPVGYDANNKFANLSPRKRGLASAHAKRRGRPPKNAKFHNSNVNIGVVGGSSGVGGGVGGVGSGGGGGSGEMEVDELL